VVPSADIARFSFANFRVKGFALGFTHVESGPLAPVPTTQNDN